MAQLYNESVLEIASRRTYKSKFVLDSKSSKEDHTDVLSQVANSLEEPMETKMLPNLPPQPKPEQRA